MQSESKISCLNWIKCAKTWTSDWTLLLTFTLKRTLTENIEQTLQNRGTDPYGDNTPLSLLFYFQMLVAFLSTHNKHHLCSSFNSCPVLIRLLLFTYHEPNTQLLSLSLCSLACMKSLLQNLARTSTMDIWASLIPYRNICLLLHTSYKHLL